MTPKKSISPQLDRLLTIPNLAIDVRFTACSENYKDFQEVYELVAKRNKLVSFDFGSCAPVSGASSDVQLILFYYRGEHMLEQ